MNSDPAELRGRVPSARRRDDGVDDGTNAGLRLSIATILPRWNMVEGSTAHGWERSTDQLVCLEVPPAPVYKGARGRLSGPLWAHQDEESSS
mgnify:CR=1 FL=1